MPADLDLDYLRSHPQMRGCVAWWPMLEGAGNTLHDVIGGNNGTINGALWTPRGLDFDGSNDHVDVGDNLDQTGSFTISAWIKPETIGYATGRRLVVKDDYNGAGDGWAFTLGDPGDGALRFFVRNASHASTDTATGVIDALTWYHVVARFDADENTKSIYVNAVREAHDTGVTGGPVNNSNALGFARDPDGTSGDPYDGILNDVRIYPRPLSESEIQDLYYDPWASARPRRCRIFTFGPSGLALFPASVAHAHAVAAPGLTQAQIAAPQSVAHEHVVAAPGLLQSHVMVPADMSHEQALQAADLLVGAALSPAAVAHEHAVAAPGLTQAQIAAPQSVAHEHVVDTASLQLAGTLSPNPLAHTHHVEPALLHQAHIIQVQSVRHVQTAEAPTLVQGLAIAVADALHAHRLDAPTLITGALVLSPDDLLHVQAAAEPTLVQAHVVQPADLRHVQVMEIAIIIPPGLVAATDPGFVSLTPRPGFRVIKTLQ